MKKLEQIQVMEDPTRTRHVVAQLSAQALWDSPVGVLLSTLESMLSAVPKNEIPLVTGDHFKRLVAAEQPVSIGVNAGHNFDPVGAMFLLDLPLLQNAWVQSQLPLPAHASSRIQTLCIVLSHGNSSHVDALLDGVAESRFSIPANDVDSVALSWAEGGGDQDVLMRLSKMFDRRLGTASFWESALEGAIYARQGKAFDAALSFFEPSDKAITRALDMSFALCAPDPFEKLLKLPSGPAIAAKRAPVYAQKLMEFMSDKILWADEFKYHPSSEGEVHRLLECIASIHPHQDILLQRMDQKLQEHADSSADDKPIMTPSQVALFDSIALSTRTAQAPNATRRGPRL